MSAPAFQCEARSLSSPECTPYHTSRDIRYIFLESCRNIPAPQPLDGAGGPASCPATAQRYLSTDKDRDSSLPRHLPAFLAFSRRAEMEAAGVRGCPDAKKRLPVFRRLCGEAVEELKFPDAPAAPGNAKGWRIALAAACPTCNKA